jgi:hypothetical protein
VADKFARAIQRKLMPELVAGLRRELGNLPGASVISDDGRVIKSPWVDPQNGQILPYNLEEDAKLVQSVSGDLWTLVEAMVESTSAKAEHARMKRFVVDTAAAVAAGLQTHLFHPYSKTVRKAWTMEKVVCKLADLRKRKLINVLTILGELVGMNQNRQSNPSQLVVYRQFVSTSGGASTRFASDIGSFGGRAPGRTFMLDLAQVSAKTYLNTFGARVCELYAESSEVSRGEAGHEEPRAADESGIPSGVPHEALYRDLYAKFDVTYRRAKSLVTLIDNFVVRVATYKTQLGARDNANIVTTEQGLVTMMRINFLRDRADRDPNLPPVGAPFDPARLTHLWTECADLMGWTKPPGCNSFTSHALAHGSWLTKLRPGFEIPHCPYVQRGHDFYPVPSIAALSSRYSDYEEHYLRRWEVLAPGLLEDGHMLAVHDSEYVLHLLKAQEKSKDSAELRKLVEGIGTVPNFLHNLKHLGECSLKNEWHLINFYVPLLVELLIYAKTKWATVGRSVKKARDEADEKVAKLREDAQADAGDEDKTAALVDALEERDEAEETLAEYVETEDAVFPLDIGDGEHEEYDGDRRSIPAAVAMPTSALTAEALAGAIDGDIGGSDDEMGTTVQCDWYVAKYMC